MLAQVDSSIGGKTGINSKYGKNLIGTFYQPEMVISDTDTLNSLPKREITCGYAEILKHALISDKKLFFWLRKNGKKILSEFSRKNFFSGVDNVSLQLLNDPLLPVVRDQTDGDRH